MVNLLFVVVCYLVVCLALEAIELNGRRHGRWKSTTHRLI